ncbi:hypothetical protein SAMN03159382_02339 [Pseudomonas sp. NFACC23-1]|uniref:hypothetical protein n=1 Tax=unclassified Pseudomonas TaxID=196821 RepID=UPI000890BE0A|nr:MULTISPECIES: hypothetical protein [unclassified Pseudomonas]SDB27776.1 hypothetical protein SAMN03159386_01999 [Pseudomonas sp. NFACC17-2]SEJ40492.1 hypothetical protein SAMN03159382_02339 [Pseudomonas sp. NFACC23-1]SFW65899.1 hypothetical protein SAMN05660640_02547 [Pseudomonas sp. NFACC16-2]
MNTSSVLIMSVLAVALTGCGNWNSVYRSHKFEEGNSAFIDIKQRAIITGGVTKNADGSVNSVVTCAEPSPDALSAYAGELAAKGDVAGKGGAELAGAYQEAASFVGMRSQSIQILRDQLYRLCEARMNNVISAPQYQMLLVRNQKYTLLLMAIEQLTGASRVPVVALTSTSSAELMGNVEVDRAQLAESEAKKKNIEAKAKGSPTEDQKKEIAAIDENIKVLKNRIEMGRRAIASGSTTQYVGSYTGASPMTGATSADVKEMVLKAFESKDSEYLCFTKLAELADPNASGGHEGAKALLVKYCEGILVKEQSLGSAGNGALKGFNVVEFASKIEKNPVKYKEFIEFMKQDAGKPLAPD